MQGTHTIQQITPAADGAFHFTSVPGSYQLVVEGEGIVARTLPVNLDKTTNLTQTIEVSRVTPSSKGNGRNKVTSVTLGYIAPPAPKPAPRSFTTMGQVAVSTEQGKIPAPPVTTPLLPPK